MAHQECDLDIEPIIFDGFTTSFYGLMHPVLHRIGVQIEQIGGGLEARLGVQKHPQRVRIDMQTLFNDLAIDTPLAA